MSIDDPHTYIHAVSGGLKALGVPVLDSWIQEDDGRHEGLIEIQDDEEGVLGFAWNSEDGWLRLWRHGPKEPGAFSKYSNTTDAAPVDEPVDDVVRMITDAAGLDPNQPSLF